MRISILLALFSASVAAFSQQTVQERQAWNIPVEPFRIIGNVHYVGAAGVSSFLITATMGHILIDGGLPETAPLVAKNVSTLGFRLVDIKYLLNSHAHFDHAGGLAELKRLTGAQLIASEGDSKTLRTGNRPSDEASTFPPVDVDRIIGDNETVKVGDVTLTAHLTPGHTKGSTTWTTQIVEGDKTRHVLFYSSTTVAANRLVNNLEYPQIVSDYERTFARVRELPCDVFLAPHGNFFKLPEKMSRRAKGGPNPFIDPAEFKSFVDNSERDFRRQLMEQQKSPLAR